jgi:hypothetical protein
MKKVVLLLVTMVLAALLFASSPEVSASPPYPPGTIECEIDTAYDGNPGIVWSGTISGCILAGAWETRPSSPSEPLGQTLHFFETFTIWPTSGGEIHGVDQGVWNFSTLKFRVNGWVTYASPEWEHLVGYKFHQSGTTSDPTALPITVEDSPARFAPANRPQ